VIASHGAINRFKFPHPFKSPGLQAQVLTTNLRFSWFHHSLVDPESPQIYAKMLPSCSITAEKNSPSELSRGRVHLIGGDFILPTHNAMSSSHWSTMIIFRFVIAFCRVSPTTLGNLPAPTSPSYLLDHVLLVYPSTGRTLSVSHIFLAFTMEVSSS
jgi:hypothetical protein